MTPAVAAQKAVAALAASDAYKATVYLDEKTVVSVCRRFKRDRRASLVVYVLMFGSPNYL